MNQRFQPEGRSNRERMLAGDQYIADDPDLGARTVAPRTWRPCSITPRATTTPAAVRCDYGYQTRRARTFGNWGLICLDVARIVIGDDVQVRPKVQLLTATHPIEPGPCRAKWEGSRLITSDHDRQQRLAGRRRDCLPWRDDRREHGGQCRHGHYPGSAAEHRRTGPVVQFLVVESPGFMLASENRCW
jgi:hypothetical protein